MQPVEPQAYDAIVKLGTEGGWEGFLPQGKKAGKAVKTEPEEVGSSATKGKSAGVKRGAATPKSNKASVKVEVKDDVKEEHTDPSQASTKPTRTSGRSKRKAAVVDSSDSELSDLPEIKPKRAGKKR